MADERTVLVEAPVGPLSVRVYRDTTRGVWGAYVMRQDGTTGPVVWAAIGSIAAKRAAWACWMDSIQVRLFTGEQLGGES